MDWLDISFVVFLKEVFMEIYVNENYEVLSIDKEPPSYYECISELGTRESLFGNWCDTCIQGYKYEPQYELLFNEDGSNARDEKTGELLYNLDSLGEKIPAGYACYPFIDFHTLKLIQKQYEENQKAIQENLAFITESLVDLDSRQTATELGLAI